MKRKHLRQLAALLPLMAAAAPAAAEDLHYNLVNFRESVSVSVPNDTLNVTLNITEKHKDRQQAAQAVTRRYNALMARIKANRALESETSGRRAYPEYDDKGRVNGWRDSVSVEVKSSDFTALTRLIANSEQEASVERLFYSVSPKKRAAAVEEASQKVLQTFRERAQNISRSLGFAGYKIVKLDLNSSFENMTADHAPMAMMAAAPVRRAKMLSEAMDDNPGEQQIRQSVDVSIQMQ